MLTFCRVCVVRSLYMSMTTVVTNQADPYNIFSDSKGFMDPVKNPDLE